MNINKMGSNLFNKFVVYSIYNECDEEELCRSSFRDFIALFVVGVTIIVMIWYMVTRLDNLYKLHNT